MDIVQTIVGFILAYKIPIIVVAILLLAIPMYNRLQKLSVKVDEGYAGIDVALELRFDLLSEQIEVVKKYLSHEYKLFTDVTALRTGAEQEEKARVQQSELTEEALKTIDREISNYAHNMEKIKGRMENISHRREGGRPNARAQDAEKNAAREVQLADNTAQRSGSINQKVNVLASAHHDLAGVGAGIDALAEQYPVMNSWVSMDKFQRSIVDSEEHLQAARRLYNSNVSLYNQRVAAFPWSAIAALFGMRKAEFYEIEEKKRSISVSFD